MCNSVIVIPFYNHLNDTMAKSDFPLFHVALAVRKYVTQMVELKNRSPRVYMMAGNSAAQISHSSYYFAS